MLEWWPAVGVAVAIALLAALLLVLAVRRRRQRLAQIPRRHGAQLKFPLVLAHGILGFDELKLGPFREQYFRGVAPRLERLGTRIYAFPVHPTAVVSSRAAALATAVLALDAPRVNIVAHSMGGLDARYLAAKLSLAGKVASIVTVGTPHRGTPLADIGAGLWLVAPTTKLLMDKAGFDAHGMLELTTARMEAFNREVVDQEGIFYGSWLAKASFTLIKQKRVPTWQGQRRKGGDNAGRGSVDLKQRCVPCGTIESDHWG